MNQAFAYIYDDFVSQRRYERDLARMETELATRGISGYVARLAMFRQSREIVSNLARGGVKNVVLVGNDATLAQAISFLPDLDVTVGYIPLGPPTVFANLLGIPVGIAAVETLAGRLVEVLDVGKCDQQYFFTEMVIPSTTAQLEVEGAYRVHPIENGAIAIRNTGIQVENGKVCANPKDGLLEAVIQTAPGEKKKKNFWAKKGLSETQIKFRNGRILSDKPIEVFLDGRPVRGQVFEISIVPKKLHMIMGRNRKI